MAQIIMINTDNKPKANFPMIIQKILFNHKLSASPRGAYFWHLRSIVPATE